MSVQPKIVADFETQLSVAISIGDTTLSLASVTDDDGVALPDGLYYLTIDNGTSSKEYLAATLSGGVWSSVLHVSRQGTETSGAQTSHRVGASVIITDFATYKKYLDNAILSGAPDASQTVKGLVEVATSAEINSDSATGGTGAPIATTPDQLALSKYGLRLPSAAEKTLLTGLLGMVGSVLPYAGRSAPSGFLMADGSAVSRSTYSGLFAVICPSMTFTVTIASPGVFSATSHGLVVGDRIHLSTTGGLPSGLAVNTDYYVISAGLTANAFEVALTPGGAAINTSGSQSGVHTMYISNFGKGDGSTTFNIPDLRGTFPLGMGASRNITLPVEAANVSIGSDTFTVPDSIFPQQGQKVQLTTTGGLPTGLSTSTDYYIIRASSTTVKFASSQANADAGTAIDISSQGTGIHTITYALSARTIIGQMGGEESHGLNVSELAGHTHTLTNPNNNYADSGSGAGGTAATNLGFSTRAPTNSSGGDTQHNNMPPYVAMNYIIKT